MLFLTQELTGFQFMDQNAENVTVTNSIPMPLEHESA